MHQIETAFEAAYTEQPFTFHCGSDFSVQAMRSAGVIIVQAGRPLKQNAAYLHASAMGYPVMLVNFKALSDVLAQLYGSEGELFQAGEETPLYCIDNEREYIRFQDAITSFSKRLEEGSVRLVADRYRELKGRVFQRPTAKREGGDPESSAEGERPRRPARSKSRA